MSGLQRDARVVHKHSACYSTRNLSHARVANKTRETMAIRLDRNVHIEKPNTDLRQAS